MKSTATGLGLLLAAALLLAGCGSPRYNVTFSYGNVVTAQSRPKLDKETDTYSFTDIYGRRYQVPAVSIREITPVSESTGPNLAPVIVPAGR